MIVTLVEEAWGAELPFSTVAGRIESGSLARLNYAFQQSDLLKGIDVIRAEQQALGPAARWLRDGLLELPQKAWRDG